MPITILADQARIKLLLRNLIDNAIRDTPVAGEHVELHFESDFVVNHAANAKNSIMSTLFTFECN